MSYIAPAYNNAGGNLSGGYIAPAYTDAGGDVNETVSQPVYGGGFVRTSTGATNIELRSDIDALHDYITDLYGTIPNVHRTCARSPTGATNQELRDDMDDIISFISQYVTISYVGGVLVSQTRATNIEIRNDIDSVSASI